jgi:hypothetical protein
MKTCQNVNKTKHPKKGEKKVQDGRIQVQAQKEKPPTKVDCKGNMNKSSIETLLLFPQVTRNISNKEKRAIRNKTFNLEKSSPTLTTFLEIKVVYTCCSATNTFCL